MALPVKGRSTAAARGRRHSRVRKMISGTPQRPWLGVTSSSGRVGALSVAASVDGTRVSGAARVAVMWRRVGDKAAHARMVGGITARRAKYGDSWAVVFSRPGNRSHGREPAVAERACDG